MPRIRFQIKTLLVITAVVALMGAWWADRSRLARQLDDLKSTVNEHGFLFELDDGFLYAPFADIETRSP